MDRRQFLAASGLAAAVPAFTNATEAGVKAEAGLFKRIDFTADGLGLDPREYSLLLQRRAASGALQPDNYSNGGLVAQLEQKFAQLLGKQAAMFLPSGTLANHLAVRTLAGNGRRVLVQAESHLYNDSGDCRASLSGLNLVPLAEGRAAHDAGRDRGAGSNAPRTAGCRDEGRRDLDRVPAATQGPRADGYVELQGLSQYAREQGIRLHLDGARLFNLPYHSGRSVREYAALFDSVYVSLWKHFNGMSGAILAGDAKFIDGLFHTRRMFGGSLPHAWPQVALVADYVDGYEQAYAQAWRAADQLIALLRAHGRYQVRKVENGTSKFFVSTAGLAPEVMAERALKEDIVLPAGPPGAVELGLQVNATLLRRSPEALALAFTRLLP